MDDQQQQPADEEKTKRLAALAGRLVELRKEAVEGRKSSGIEDVWKAAEEAYLGIDDVNRAQWEKAQWAKPTSMQGPLTRATTGDGTDNRSTVFIPLTARYVDAGHAKVSELLLPMDDKPFAFDPTPVPELIAARDMLKQVMQNGGEFPPQQPQPMAAAVAPDSLMTQQPAASMQPVPQTPQDAFAAAKDAVARATTSAKAAEKRIYDWIVEAKHAVEMRKVLFDSARIGVGILKGPFVESRTSTALTRDEAGNVAIEIKKERKPGERQVDPWNFFPDPACGEDVTKGSYCFERDYMSPAQVKKLPAVGSYLPDQIELVLDEGPSKCYLTEDGQRNPSAVDDPKIKAKRFELYHFYGEISAEDLMVANENLASKVAKRETYHVTATLINERVVRVVLNPLDTGRMPYRVFPWRRRSGHWTGVGIGEQCSPAQVMCNGATRAMLTNAGQSAGVQLIIDRTSIVPVDGKWIITPNKVWVKKSDATIDDMTKAFTAVEIPDRQQSLMNIIEYSFRIAEESTNIPLISQGQSGPSQPDTYGAAALQNNNANQLLRSIATTCDDCITEPLIRDYYEWLLLDPDVPNEEKGDFNINAHGSSALVERAIQDQVIQQLVEPSLNPAFELSPARVMEEYLKSKRIDYRSLKLTDEEKAEMAKRQPPPPPAVQAAQIRAQAQMQSDKLREQTAQLRIKKDTDRDAVYVQAETQRTQVEFTSRREELAVRRELALIEYANKTKQTLETIKAKLADTVLRLRTQKELALGAATIDLHKHRNPTPQVATPGVEVPGRAPNGEAFQA
jgi:hypothetical protein